MTGVHHDLMHYALEKKLQFKQGFYGLLNQGFDIGDFELPREQRPEALRPKNLPLEAQQGEFITGILQTAHWQKQSPSDTIGFLKTIYKEKGWAFPEYLNETKIETILEQFNALWQEWLVCTDELVLAVDWL